MGGSGQGLHEVTLALRAGSIDLVASQGAVRLCGLRPEVRYDRTGAEQVWRPALERDAGGAYVAESEVHGLRLLLRLGTEGGAAVADATLTNIGHTPIRLARVAPLATTAADEVRIGARADRWSILRQGYQSWTGTRSFRAHEVDPDPLSTLLSIGLIDLRNPSPQRPGHFRSDMFAAVANLRSGEVLVAGFLACRAAFGGIEVVVHGRQCRRFAAVADLDDVLLPAGEEIGIEPVWIGSAASVHDGLRAYTVAVAAAMQARVPARAPVGWCSWYHYFTNVSEAAMLENLRGLAALRPSVRFDYVQVDDGYQSAIGDWLTTNPRFPRGMGSLATQIAAEGFEPGIWIAPFIARRGSRLLREHPDWFVQSERRRPRFALYNPVWGWWGNCYAIDTTHPAVQDWLRNLIHTLVHFWGYRVLKLDFLYAAALPGRRYDARATRAGALRRGLEIIRETAGDDVFLLGCGCPLGPAIGVVDAMRIGPDVAPFWSKWLTRGPQRDLHGLATKHAVRNMLTRSFLHRVWWLNDPDCLMVRETDTELTLDEVLTLATAIAVTDGMVVLSDSMKSVTPERLAVLQRTLAATGGRAEVVDLMRADMPEVVVNRAPGRTLLAVFNFADEPRVKRIDMKETAPELAGATTATDWWTGEPVAIRAGLLDLGELPAHGSRLLTF